MTIQQLQDKATEIREDIIKMLVNAGSGHSAGSLGMADVFTALYFGGKLNLDPQDPWNENRDRIILSNGHICPVLYATLAHAGYFPKEELLTFRKINSRLQGHPHFRSAPGVENTSGPLGQGMSAAVGVAMAVRMKYSSENSENSEFRNTVKSEDQKARSSGSLVLRQSDLSDSLSILSIPKLTRLPRVICLTSDAELQEGQAWEAAMFAAKNNLDHLTFITDRNHIQIGGFTEDIMPLEPLAEKIGAFGFNVLSVNGHNIQEILNALDFDLSLHRKPVWIIANTIPGKGVAFMENMPNWHGIPPMEKGQAVEALAELNRLRTLGGRIIGGHE